MKQYRHGDLLVIKIESIPTSAVRVNHKILALGETTGHAHRLTDAAQVFEDADGTLYFDAPAGAGVSHEEHATIEFPPGTYQVIRQREYDPYEQVIRQVAD